MNKDLAKAISLHTEGLHDKALHYYTKCIKHSPKCSPLLYQTMAPCCALILKLKGLELQANEPFPNNVGITTILTNRGDDSLQVDFSSSKLTHLNQDDVKKRMMFLFLLTLLSEIGCGSWAFRIVSSGSIYKSHPDNLAFGLPLEEQLPASVHLSLLQSLSKLDAGFPLQKKQNCISVLLMCWQMAILVCDSLSLVFLT